MSSAGGIKLFRNLVSKYLFVRYKGLAIQRYFVTFLGFTFAVWQFLDLCIKFSLSSLKYLNYVCLVQFSI